MGLVLDVLEMCNGEDIVQMGECGVREGIMVIGASEGIYV